MILTCILLKKKEEHRFDIINTYHNQESVLDGVFVDIDFRRLLDGDVLLDEFVFAGLVGEGNLKIKVK